MKIRSAWPAAALALALGAAPAQAETVESALTAAMSVQFAFPEPFSDPVLVETKLTTKDLIAELAEAMEIELGGSAKLVVRRETADPEATDPDFTAGDLVLIVGGEEHDVDEQSFLAFTPLELPEGFAEATAQAVKLRTSDLEVQTRTREQLRGLQTGDLDLPPSGNGQQIELVGLEIATEKLTKLKGGGEALFFSKRTVAVTGGAAFNTELPDLPAGFPESGIVTGTLALSAEKYER